MCQEWVMNVEERNVVVQLYKKHLNKWVWYSEKKHI